MNLNIFNRFEQAVASGNRFLAATELAAFIASFTSREEKDAWARSYLESASLGHKIRHEIYEHLVFPLLAAGYRQSDPWSLRWLERTVQNLYQARHLWEQVEMKTGIGFARQLLAVCPKDEGARKRVLTYLIESFRYAAHEWPAGILLGSDGAKLGQCEEMMEEIETARRLDVEGIYTDFLADFKHKLVSYMHRLQDASRGAARIEP